MWRFLLNWPYLCISVFNRYMQVIRFSHQAPRIHQELRRRVNQYFQETGKKQTGNWSLYLKSALLLSAVVFFYIHLVFFTPAAWLAILESVLLGFAVSMVGFNVMHDGAHGSFSPYKWLNEMAGHSVNFLGANIFMWKTKHNTVHHTFTNIEGVDDDIDAGVFLRLSPEQKWHRLHKYQYLYFPFVYAMLYLFWVFFTDYKKYFTGKVGVIPIQKMEWYEHINFWGFKLFFIGAFVAFPIYMVGFVPWLVGFLIFSFTTGIVLSMVFQLAHTVEDTAFPVPDDAARMEDEWAVHQLRTTANFANGKRWVLWVTGGLNYQIEHHLFPNISHIHYPAISRIVRDVCKEYQLPYVEYPKFREAVMSHIRHLREMGQYRQLAG
jgi:linoleoyl-CoA desaturase